ADLLEPILEGGKSISASINAFIAEHSSAELAALADALTLQLGGGPELLPEFGDVMSWEEARVMASRGFTIGAHTVNHVVLPLTDLETARREIVESKAMLEQGLGMPICDFAYPNGWYSPEVKELLRAAGFRSGMTTEDLPNRLGGDPYALKRKVLSENFSVGFDGTYSESLTVCQMDRVFEALSVRQPVFGEMSRGDSNPRPSA
ncbi:MAG TPA: polysaccharide deacetylase family protein, partial [Myxococcaceae bacterium]|nr:polysaccharide deacetylase family protein [Myxococcaceae bacterium]